MPMLLSSLKYLKPLHRIRNLNFAQRNFASFLYVPKVLSNMTAVLPPQLEHLFCEDDIPKIKDTLKSRQMFKDDIDTVCLHYQQVNELNNEMVRLETLKHEKILNIQEKLNLEDAEVQQRIQKGRQIKIEMKAISNRLKEIEKLLIPKLLTLPNILHPDVPLTTCRTRKISSANCPVFGYPVKSHIEIGSKGNSLKFSNVNPGAYYLLGRVAALELAILDYFSGQFSKSGFIRFANPDICKAIVVEGCGIDINNPLNSFQIDEENSNEEHAEVTSGIHLTGSASLPSFCAYYAKHVVRSLDMPMKHFVAGRCYRPASPNTGDSLFNPQQSSQLYFYIAHNGRYNEVLFRDSLETLLKCFNELDVHYRVVDVCAPKLLLSENRRTEIQMWSPHLESYVPVSSISEYGNYIAKRLWMCYRETKKLGFTHLVGGNAITISPFLGCLIENLQTQNGDFEIPNVLQSCITKFY